MGFFHRLVTGDFADFDDMQDVYNSIMVLVCIVCAGLAAGLTIGLLSLDVTKLEIKLMIGSNEEKSAVNALLPIVQNHHLLLVTLLLFNSLANETLPIFLGALVPNYVAVLLSVTLVLIFGEIIPSALFTGPNQLMTAAKLSSLVYFLLGLFYPIAFPIAKILDYLFGIEEGGGNITREELEALVVLQGSEPRNSVMSNESSPLLNQRKPSPQIMSSQRGGGKDVMFPFSGKEGLGGGSGPGSKESSNNSRDNSLRPIHPPNNSLLLQQATSSSAAAAALSPPLSISSFQHHQHNHHSHHHHSIGTLSDNEVSLMTGILRLSKFTVKDTMIPIKRVNMVSSSTRLDEKSLYDILDSGFSRIPVFKRHDRQHVLGYLLVKELIVVSLLWPFLFSVFCLFLPFFRSIQQS
jgi:metal transporter CNNM